MEICRRSTRPTILLFGDSITQQSFSPIFRGWGASLADWFTRRADVINRGYSGYNSRWGFELIKQLMPEGSDQWNDVLFATVFFGANDAVHPGGDQHVPVAEYKQNLISIIRHIRASIGSRIPIILVTPPMVDADQWPTRSVSAASQYAEAVRAASAEADTLLLDFWNQSEWEMQITDLRDGLHFGETGNNKMSEGLKHIIRSQLPHINPEATSSCIPMHYPDHKILGKSSFLPADLEEAKSYKSIISSWQWETTNVL